MERYTAINGEVIEYPTPDVETGAFLTRVVAAANDPNVSEHALHELVYGRENPILDQTIFAGRGAVTREVVTSPLYSIMLDLIAQKQVLSGRLNLARAADAYTLSVADAAKRIGVTEDAVRKAIKGKRLATWKRGASYWLAPRDCDNYREHVVPRKPRSGEQGG